MALVTYSKTYVIDLDTKKEVYSIDAYHGDFIDDHRYAYSYDDGYIHVVDYLSGKEIKKYDVSAGEYDISNITASDDGMFLAIKMTNVDLTRTRKSKSGLIVYNTKTGKKTEIFRDSNMDSNRLADYKVEFASDNRMIAFKEEGMIIDGISYEMHSITEESGRMDIVMMDMSYGNTLWQMERKDIYTQEYSDIIYDDGQIWLTYGSTAEKLNVDDGHIEKIYHAGSVIVDSYVRKDRFHFITSDGKENFELDNGTASLDFFPENLAAAQRIDNKIYVQVKEDDSFYMKPGILIYTLGMSDPNYVEVEMKDVPDDIQYEEYDMDMTEEDKTLIKNLGFEEEPVGVAQIPKSGNFLIAFEDKIVLCNKRTGEKAEEKAEISLSNAPIVIIDEHNSIVLHGTGAYVVCNDMDCFGVMGVISSYGVGYSPSKDSFYFFNSKEGGGGILWDEIKNGKKSFDGEIGYIKRYTDEDVLAMAREKISKKEN